MFIMNFLIMLSHEGLTNWLKSSFKFVLMNSCQRVDLHFWISFHSSKTDKCPFTIWHLTSKLHLSIISNQHVFCIFAYVQMGRTNYITGAYAIKVIWSRISFVQVIELLVLVDLIVACVRKVTVWLLIRCLYEEDMTWSPEETIFE